MKTKSLRLILLSFLFLLSLKSFSQSTPEWIRDINQTIDSAMLQPVRVVTDDNNFIYVASTYYKSTPTGIVTKVCLYKYDSTGLQQWFLKYDNNGTANVRVYDMAVDQNGNCYLAGYIDTSANKPMLLKVNSSGAVVWMTDSTSNFQTGSYNQLILKNNYLYAKATQGFAKFDLNGNEIFSMSFPVERIAVDSKGQVIFSGYLGNPNAIFRLDVNGNLNFMDSMFTAKKIAVDYNDNFYLLNDYPQYQFAMYDSTGTRQWMKNNFPAPPPFGDIGFDVIVNGWEVVLVGLSDTMFKFDTSGNLLWKKSMNGLDSYLISAKSSYSNMIAVAGSVPDVTGYYLKVAFYDINGSEVWSGVYNHDPVLQEYSVDVATDYYGIYAIENFADSTTLVKFHNPAMDAVDYSLICVDSVWYEPGNPDLINVSIFNGNFSHMNYPSVQIVSPLNDTIGNPNNFVWYFAHLGNTYQIYQDTITQPGIPNFSNYTFLMSEGFGTTTNQIYWCISTSVEEPTLDEISIYPNPATDFLNVNISPGQFKNPEIEIYDCLGKIIFRKNFPASDEIKIDVGSLSGGMYFLVIRNAENIINAKFIVD